jgi:hypothetical protein
MCYSHIRLHLLSYLLEEVVVVVVEEEVVVVVVVVEEEEEVVVVVVVEEVVVVMMEEAVVACKCRIHSYWSCKHYCCKGSHSKDCYFLCFIHII